LDKLIARRLYSAPMKAAPLALVLLALPLAGMTATPGPPPVFITPSGEPIRPTPQAPDAFETWFARLDAQHDGKIDRAEFRADAEQFFKRLDTNRDGVIDGFEISAYEKTVAPELDIAGQGFARGGSADVASLLSDPEPVSSADLQLNAHITLAEWLSVADHRFDLLDVRHQGYLTRDGLRALLPKSAREIKP
jgi:Ca2+-binding EF-hand superfamily protein